MIGHLGTRVSALLDGQLAAREADRCWAHVHECRACWDLVEREGWLKTQLAGLSRDSGPGATPDALKGSLRSGAFSTTSFPAGGQSARSRGGLLLWGGTAVGAAVVGMVALGVAPGGTPADRRSPVTAVTQPVSSNPAVDPAFDPAASPARALPARPLTGSSTVPSSRAGITNIGLSVSTRRLAGGIPGFKMVP